MSAASFVHPEWLAPLSALWLLAAGLILAGRALERRRAQQLLGPSRRPAAGSLARDALLLGCLAGIALALVGPRIGERSVRSRGTGVDVVFLLDVSRSMDARDVPPSRLDRARAATVSLSTALSTGDRAALAVFAGRGVLLTPLTTDFAAVGEVAAVLDSDWVRPAASQLGEGVRAALSAFDVASNRPRVIVILSDGEDPDGAEPSALPEVLRAHARVVAIAFGTEQGASIPDHGTVLHDASGRPVTTRRQSSRLDHLARASDGALFEADAWGAFDAVAASEALRRDAPDTPGEWNERSVPAVRSAPLALLALILLAFDRNPLPRRRMRMAATAVAGALLLGAGGAGREPDARDLLAAGLARAERSEFDEAGRAFLAAALRAGDPETAAMAYYDRGVAMLRAGRFDQARDSFFEALAVSPGDSKARFNLEWTLKAMDSEPPKQPRNQPEDREDPGRPTPSTPDIESPETPSPEQMPPRDRTASKRPPPMTREEAERWMDRTPDQPGQALRASLQEERRGRLNAGPSPW